MRLRPFLQTMMSVAAFALAMPASASADDGKIGVPVRAVNAASAPVSMKNARMEWICGSTWENRCGGTVSRMIFYVELNDAISSRLLSMNIEFKVYDADGSLIGTANESPTFDSPVLHGEPQVVKIDNDGSMHVGVPFTLTEPPSGISHVAMRITTASFTGGKTWILGKGFVRR